MRLLVLDNNSSFEINEIPDEVDDIRFCVLDNSDPKNPDYFFIPLIVSQVLILLNFLTIIYCRNWLRDGDIFLNFRNVHSYPFPADA